MQLFRTIFTLLLTTLAFQTHAEGFYIGAGAGFASSSFSDVDAAGAAQATLGYRFLNSPIGIEAASFGTSSMDVNTDAGGEFTVKGSQLTLLWNFMDANSRFNAFARVGGYSLDNDFEYTPGFWYYPDCPSGHCSASSSGVVLGGGAEFNIAKHLSAYAGIDVYPNVDFIVDTSTMFTGTVGIRAKF